MSAESAATAYEPAAQQAAQRWLQLTDAGDAAKSWRDASALFRARVDETQWAKALQGARAPLGALVHRTLEGARHAGELPGAPDGDYVVLTYRTEFEHKHSAVETVTPMKDEDGQWRVSGYFIR
jgi:hypothetical protein